MTEATEGDGWEVDPDDEQGAAVVATAGRQLRSWREAAGLRVPELAEAMGYGEGIVYKVEAGKRIPRPEYLERADEVLGARGILAGLREDLKEVRYPKKVRDLARMEAQAVELLAYGDHNFHGLLQTPEYARALFEMRLPAYDPDEIERAVAAREARKAVFERSPSPALSFVQEEVTLRRPLGGRMVMRQQLEHLVALAQKRAVSIQVMPTASEEHAGMQGELQVLKFKDGTAVGRSEGAFNGRPVTEPKQLRVLELRYGMIRAQALTPGESLAFIEQVLGET
ncbi:helix-turn-helix transcriptional regulator [Streptomyces sp. NPDC006552]|uniref:helix-turn-helix domain-containing protein n=1 Tax=Streptomyces sp. NPDC006552 TaxID=3157179 RepID=UPI0033BDD088